MNSKSLLPFAVATLLTLGCLTAAETNAPDPSSKRAIPNEREFGMGPPVTAKDVSIANASVDTAMPKGPFEPSWDSLKTNYKTPAWYSEARFGLSMHWGIYSVPAQGSEWYEKHMYGNPGIARSHAERFGPQKKFGYKDFIPLFTCEKFDPDAWAELFLKSGAKYFMPTAQHHDNFALWDSQVARWNTKQMGPKRDIMGELAVAVRKRGIKFGIANHGIENFTFINPIEGLETDLYDPSCADFYQVADRSPEAVQRFLADWLKRNFELIDKYQPDLLWFDNGVNARAYDPLKLRVAAYYYNSARRWGKEVALNTKGSGPGAAFLTGTIHNFERQGRGHTSIQTEAWEVHDSPFQRWGYLSDAKYWNPGDTVWRLIECASKNGNFNLNLAPRPDGTIPEEQVRLLLSIGKWLEVNGEAIYGTHAWTKFGEGESMNNRPAYTGKDIRFTVKGDTLYAILMAWPGEEAHIASLGTSAGRIQSLVMLGEGEELEFQQDAAGLHVKMPAAKPCEHAYTLRITGLIQK